MSEVDRLIQTRHMSAYCENYRYTGIMIADDTVVFIIIELIRTQVR